MEYIHCLLGFLHDHIRLYRRPSGTELYRLRAQLRNVYVLHWGLLWVKLNDIIPNLILVALHAHIFYLIDATNHISIVPGRQRVYIAPTHVPFYFHGSSQDREPIIEFNLSLNRRHGVFRSVCLKNYYRRRLHRNCRVSLVGKICPNDGNIITQCGIEAESVNVQEYAVLSNRHVVKILYPMNGHLEILSGILCLITLRIGKELFYDP